MRCLESHVEEQWCGLGVVTSDDINSTIGVRYLQQEQMKHAC